MKKEIHPEYRPVVFQDISSNFAILTRSTVKTKETTQWEDGNTYPVVKIDISSESHPFFTGKQRIVDTGGRIDRFKKKFQERVALGGHKKIKKETKPKKSAMAAALSEKLKALKDKVQD